MTSREAQELLDRLCIITETIEAHEATLYLLRQEQMKLRSQLAAIGYRLEPQGELLR